MRRQHPPIAYPIFRPRHSVWRTPTFVRCPLQPRLGGGTSKYYTVCLTRPLVCAKLLKLRNDLSDYYDRNISVPFLHESDKPQNNKRKDGRWAAIGWGQKRFREIASADPKDTWTALDVWSRPEGKLQAGAFGPRYYWMVGLPYEMRQDSDPSYGQLPDKDTFVARYKGQKSSPPDEATGAFCRDKLLGTECEDGYKCNIRFKGDAFKNVTGNLAGTCQKR
jgi:hypothetical protein